MCERQNNTPQKRATAWLRLQKFLLLSSSNIYIRQLYFLWENLDDRADILSVWTNRQYYRVNFKDILSRQTKIHNDITPPWWNTEIMFFFQPYLLINDSKEPHGSDNSRTSSFGKWSWFWASVEVHIQNSESTRRRCMRGGLLKLE